MACMMSRNVFVDRIVICITVHRVINKVGSVGASNVQNMNNVIV